MIRLLRAVLAFVVFIVTYAAMGFLIYGLVYFVNRYLDRTGEWISGPWAAIFAGIGGMMSAVKLTDQMFTPYPRRVFAALFIVPMVSILALSAVATVAKHEPFTLKDLSSTLAQGLACITAWWLLWRRPKPPKPIAIH